MSVRIDVVRILCRTLVSVAIVLTGSCDDNTGPSTPLPPAAIVIVAGQGQTGTVATELPVALSVRVADDRQRPLARQIVNFRVISGGGRVGTGVAISGPDGVAAERWTLGTVSMDTQRVEVRWINPVTGDGTFFTEFFAVGVADAPASIEKIQGDRQTITVGVAAHDSLAVRVKDTYGNPVVGASVVWTPDSGSGTVSPATSKTDAQGIARTQWTGASTVRDGWSVSASIAALSVSFSAVAYPATATRLVLVQPASGAAAAAPFAVQPSLRFLDQYDNVASVPDARVTMTASAGATPIGVTQVDPVAAGVIVFNNAGLTGLVGTYTLTYTATLNGSVMTAMQDIVLAAGAPHHYVVSADLDTVHVGEVALLEAKLEDAAGNQLSLAGRSVTWSVVGAGGTFVPATSTTNQSGLATTTLTMATRFTSDSAKITANDASASGSVRIPVTTDIPSRLSFTAQPSNVPYGVRYPISVEIQDIYGNRIADDTSTVWLIIERTGMQSGGSVHAVNGTATFPDVRFDVPGSGYMLWATANDLTSAQTQPFSVSTVGVVLTSQSGISGLAVRDSMVYTPVGAVSVNGVRTIIPDPLPAGIVGVYTTVAMNGVYAYLEKFITQTEPSTHYGGLVVAVNAATGASQSYPIYECIPSPDLETDGTSYYLNCDVIIGLPGIWRVGPAGYGSRLANTDGNVPFALVGNEVYYYCCGSIFKVAPGGGASLLISQAGYRAAGGPRRLAVIGGTIYWSVSGAIRSGPASGGVATTIVTGLSSTVFGLRGDGNWIYFVDDTTLKRFLVADPTVVQTVLPGENVTDFALDDRSLYWATNGFVKKTPKN